MAQVGENYKPPIEYENPDIQLKYIDQANGFAVYCINGYVFIASGVSGVYSEVKWYQPDITINGKNEKMKCECVNKEGDL
jgi:hypothetical protein